MDNGVFSVTIGKNSDGKIHIVVTVGGVIEEGGDIDAICSPLMEMLKEAMETIDCEFILIGEINTQQKED